MYDKGIVRFLQPPAHSLQPNMHELSIVEALIEQVEETLAEEDEKGRVLKLELSIGRLSGVSAEAVRFVFELLSADTAVEGAELKIIQPKAWCNCRQCGAQTEIEELVVQCPRCGSGKIVIEGGRELLLQSIDVEE